MLKLITQYHQWKKVMKLYIISKLTDKVSYEDEIYNDILDVFSYYPQGYYTLHMRNAPIGECDLERIIQARRNDYTRVNDSDLYQCYSYLIDYLHDKFKWCNEVVIYTVNDNDHRKFEVHIENKQEK